MRKRSLGFLIGTLVLVPSAALGGNHLRAQLDAAARSAGDSEWTIDRTIPWGTNGQGAGGAAEVSLPSPRVSATAIDSPRVSATTIDRNDPWPLNPKPDLESFRTYGRRLDMADPWSPPALIAEAPGDRRALDTADPWTSGPSAPSAPQPARAAEEKKLREAIKAAIDAGELERAGDLLRVLRRK